MNKNLKLLILVIAFTIVPMATIPSVYAWDDCPHGEVNDPYPGDCSKYIDTDNDGICDHSQPAPEDRLASTPIPTETVESTAVAPEPKIESEEEHDEMYSVEVSGQEMKEMTLQEIADAWNVDVNKMIYDLKEAFNLNGDYASTDMLEAMRDEYKFSPAQAKAVVENLAQESGTSLVDFDASDNPSLVSNNIDAQQSQIQNIESSSTDDWKNIAGLTLLTLPLILLGGYVVYNKFASGK